MDKRVPIRSTWKQPVGKKLTDALIRKWEKLGYYGEAVQSNYVVQRCCECDKKGAIYYRWKYLPTPGFYCLSCLGKYRAAKEREELEKQKWREQLLKEYE